MLSLALGKVMFCRYDDDSAPKGYVFLGALWFGEKVAEGEEGVYVFDGKQIVWVFS